jgi:hypothetical protein
MLTADEELKYCSDSYQQTSKEKELKVVQNSQS